MIEEFTTLYEDGQGFVHLYYFPGIDSSGHPICMPIDMSKTNYDYTFKKHEDGAIDYKFTDKSVHKVTVTLVNKKTQQSKINTIEI